MNILHLSETKFIVDFSIKSDLDPDPFLARVHREQEQHQQQKQHQRSVHDRLGFNPDRYINKFV